MGEMNGERSPLLQAELVASEKQQLSFSSNKEPKYSSLIFQKKH